MKDLLVYDIRKRKQVLVGQYDEPTGVFHKEVKPKHYMRIRGGYGISESALKELLKFGCKYIYINNGQEVRSIPFDIWYMQRTEGFGHDAQKFFPWDRMNVVVSNQMELGIV